MIPTVLTQRRGGAEQCICLLLLSNNNNTAPSVTDDDTRHLVWLRGQLGDNLADAAVLTTGDECYRRKQDDIAVIPAARLGP